MLCEDGKKSQNLSGIQRIQQGAKQFFLFFRVFSVIPIRFSASQRIYITTNNIDAKSLTFLGLENLRYLEGLRGTGWSHPCIICICYYTDLGTNDAPFESCCHLVYFNQLCLAWLFFASFSSFFFFLLRFPCSYDSL